MCEHEEQGQQILEESRWMILERWVEKVQGYDNSPKGSDYNRTYERIMGARPKKINIKELIDSKYIVEVIRALEGFDMARSMGRNRCDFSNPLSFAFRLRRELQDRKEALRLFLMLDPVDFNISDPVYQQAAKILYEGLARKSRDGLDDRNYSDNMNRTFAFDVGATKLLHFLFPFHFAIVDRYAAIALRSAYPGDFKYRSNFPIG